MQNRIVFRHKAFSNISPLDYWRFVIDGELQTEEKGAWLAYEQRERGSVKSLIKAYAYMLENVDKVVTEEFIKELHKRAVQCASIEELAINKNDKFEGQYRANTPVCFGVRLNSNGTKAGMTELYNGHPKEVLFDLYKSRSFFGYLNTPRSEKNDTYFEISPQINHPDQLSIEVNKILGHYHQEVKKIHADNTITDPELAILKEILRCVKYLELTHPFRDANCRTFCILLFQKLLLENNLPLTILTDPNRFDGFTIDELVTEVKIGMERVTKLPDLKPTTAELIKMQTEDWDKDIRKIHITNPLHLAVLLDIPGFVKETIQHITKPEKINSRDMLNKTALMMAAAKGDIEVVNLLLQHPEIDINAQDQFGYTAAMLAADAGHADLANFLFNHEKADKKKRSIFGTTVETILNKQNPENVSFIEIFEKVRGSWLGVEKADWRSFQMLTQDVTTQQQNMINEINNYFNIPMAQWDLVFLISLYGKLKKIEQPLIAKNNFLQEIKNKIMLFKNATPADILRYQKQNLDFILPELISDLGPEIKNLFGSHTASKVTDEKKVEALNIVLLEINVLQELNSEGKLSPDKLGKKIEEIAWILYKTLGDCPKGYSINDINKTRIMQGMFPRNEPALEFVRAKLEKLDIMEFVEKCFASDVIEKPTLLDIKNEINKLIGPKREIYATPIDLEKKDMIVGVSDEAKQMFKNLDDLIDHLKKECQAAAAATEKTRDMLLGEKELKDKDIQKIRNKYELIKIWLTKEIPEIVDIMKLKVKNNVNCQQPVTTHDLQEATLHFTNKMDDLKLLTGPLAAYDKLENEFRAAVNDKIPKILKIAPSLSF